jgi:hypothetical protein
MVSLLKTTSGYHKILPIMEIGKIQNLIAKYKVIDKIMSDRY